MPYCKELLRLAPFVSLPFLLCAMGLEEIFFKSYNYSDYTNDEFNCTQEDVNFCVICRNGSFANNSLPSCSCCRNNSRPGYCMNSSCTLCPIGTFQNMSGKTSCQDCPIGTFCGNCGCTFCSGCPCGYEAKHEHSSKCTQCNPGYFKRNNNTSLCQLCPQGSCCQKPGTVNPRKCENDEVCPAGCQEPIFCDVPWHIRENGEKCNMSAAIIVIICILVPIAILIIVIIIYKFCKWYKWRWLHSELSSGEREPLLPPQGNRTNARVQDPVYTGL